MKVKNSSESKERKLLYGLPILMNDRDGFFTLFNGEKPNNKQKIINSSKELEATSSKGNDSILCYNLYEFI